MLTRVYCGNPIRQREDGYLCLTDMAKAAGKRVNHWLSNQGTVDLIRVFEGSTGIPADRLVEVNESAGSNDDRGTWAYPEIGISFAMWCSPEFHALSATWVNDIRTKGFAVDARRPMDFAAIIRDPKRLPALTLQLAQLVEEQATELAEAAPKVEAHDRLMKSEGSYSLMDAARLLGRQPIKFIAALVADGLLFRNAHGVPEPTADYRERGVFVVITVPVRCGEVDRPRIQTKVTPEGLGLLAARYPRTDAVRTPGRRASDVRLPEAATQEGK